MHQVNFFRSTHLIGQFIANQSNIMILFHYIWGKLNQYVYFKDHNFRKTYFILNFIASNLQQVYNVISKYLLVMWSRKREKNAVIFYVYKNSTTLKKIEQFAMFVRSCKLNSTYSLNFRQKVLIFLTFLMLSTILKRSCIILFCWIDWCHNSFIF